VLIKTAEQLKNFTKEEEAQMEDIIRAIANTGAKVVVSGSAISDIAMHFLERYQLMVVKVPSKFQLLRVCHACGATGLVRLGAPTAEELGFCDDVTVSEIGGTKVVIFRQEKEDSKVSTLVVRASTQNILDDIERAIDDGVNAYKNLVKDGRFLAGAGAVEIELARRLAQFAESTPGLDQYAMRRFAEAFEVVPRTLAENAGMQATEVIASLYAAHHAGKIHTGVDVEGNGVKDAAAADILDSLLTKLWAVRYASDAVNTILRVDQIIMSKPAGGPKARPAGPADADDDGPMAD
jgi:T-complex protein 1 subunit theta